jgi:Tfp pilus assembly protein FimT
LQQQQIVGTALLALTLPNLAQVAMHLRVGSIVKPVAAAVALAPSSARQSEARSRCIWTTGSCDTFLPHS